MAQAQVNKFISFVSTDPAGWQEASKETNDPEQLLRNVVQYAQAKGYDFTDEEVKAWATEYGQRPPDGALTDSELAAVAGGGADGDDKLSDSAQLELQKMMDKQSRTLQIMSNMSKMVHDTANSAIHNIKS